MNVHNESWYPTTWECIIVQATFGCSLYQQIRIPIHHPVKCCPWLFVDEPVVGKNMVDMCIEMVVIVPIVCIRTNCGLKQLPTVCCYCVLLCLCLLHDACVSGVLSSQLVKVQDYCRECKYSVTYCTHWMSILYRIPCLHVFVVMS